MAVKLRLKRMGRKKRPFYRVIAADSRAPRDGRFIEKIGYYDPLTDPARVELDEERVLYWLGVGAIPSPTVKNMLSKQGIILKFDLSKRGLPQEKIDEELKKWEALQLEKQRRVELLQKLKEEEKTSEKEKAKKEEVPAEEPTVAVEAAPEPEKSEASKPEESTEAAVTEETAGTPPATEDTETPETPETTDSEKNEPVAEAEKTASKAEKKSE